MLRAPTGSKTPQKWGLYYLISVAKIKYGLVWDSFVSRAGRGGTVLTLLEAAACPRGCQDRYGKSDGDEDSVWN